jgi:hypothetical protein
MTQTTDAPPTEPAVQASSRFSSDRDGWLTELDRVGDDAGYFQSIGARHWAFFADEDATLLVTFETAQSLRARPDGLPEGYAVAKAHGWSHLCLIAEGPTWYRDPAVYGFFDRLVDDAFFEDFDRVVFYGAGQGAYAACAYSVAAPGATVLAVQPVATLDPSVAGWDPRHAEQRRLCFTDRYGFAPDMTDGAARVFLLFDPEQQLDAMHAALFARPHVTALRCRRLGAKIEAALSNIGILTPLVEAACEGRLTPAVFHNLYRGRRSYGPYLRALAADLDANDRALLAGLLARNVTSRMQAPRFRQKLTQLAADGVGLPPQGKIGKP